MWERWSELALHAELDSFHPIFRVTMLKKSLEDPASIYLLKVDEILSYEEVPVVILERQVERLRNKEIATLKVLWRNHLVEGATWEAESNMISRYHYIFSS